MPPRSQQQPRALAPLRNCSEHLRSRILASRRHLINDVQWYVRAAGVARRLDYAARKGWICTPAHRFFRMIQIAQKYCVLLRCTRGMHLTLHLYIKQRPHWSHHGTRKRVMHAPQHSPATHARGMRLALRLDLTKISGGSPAGSSGVRGMHLSTPARHHRWQFSTQTILRAHIQGRSSILPFAR